MLNCGLVREKALLCALLILLQQQNRVRLFQVFPFDSNELSATDAREYGTPFIEKQ